MVDLFKVDRNSWNTALILNNKQVFELYRLMLKGFYSCSDKKECVRYSFTYGDMFRHIADFLVEDFSKTLISKSIILEEIIDLELFRKYNKESEAFLRLNYPEKRMRELDLPFYRFQITEIKAYSIGDEFKIKPVMVVLKYKPEQSDMEIDAAFNKCEFGVLLEDIVRYTGRTYSIDELEGVING